MWVAMNIDLRSRHQGIEQPLAAIFLVIPQVINLSESRIDDCLIKQLLYELSIYLNHILFYLSF